MKPESANIFETLKAECAVARTKKQQSDVHEKILGLLRNGIRLSELSGGLGLVEFVVGDEGQQVRLNIRDQIAALFPVKFSVKQSGDKEEPVVATATWNSYKTGKRGRKRKPVVDDATNGVVAEDMSLEDKFPDDITDILAGIGLPRRA